MVVKLVTATGGFLILGVISRTYGDSGVGNFTLALAYLAFFNILSDFGFNAYIIRRLQGGGYNEWRKFLGTRIVWSLIITVLAAVFLVFLPFNPPSFGFSSDFKLTVLIGAVIIFFMALNLASLALFQAKLKYQYDILPTIIGAIASVSLIFYLAGQRYPIYILVLGLCLGWSIHSIGALISTAKFTSLLPQFDFKFTKRLFVKSWPLAAMLILNNVYFRIDTFVLSFNYSAGVVGIYNLAYQVFQTILVLPAFIMNAFYPMMLESLRVNLERFNAQIKKAFLGLTFVSIFLSIITYLLAPFIVKVIAGSGFEGSVESLRILALSFPAYFLSSLALWIMIAKSMSKQIIVIYLIGLIFNFLANLIFIPQYSFVAASWITGISEYLILGMQVVILLFEPQARTKKE